MQDELDELREALRDTQDRLMAAEGLLRVLMYCLHETQAVPAGKMILSLQQAIRALHSYQQGEEFPRAVRELIAFRDYLESVERAPRPR